jgi:hypothetical protein
MFSGRWDDNLVKDEQGAFFIDQPYEHFKALLDFFRSCKSAAVNGPPASIAGFGGVATSLPFMRMVDYYNCTPEVYPVEIKAVKEGDPKTEPKIRQYPNMSVEYHRRPEDGRDGGVTYRFSSIGHSRLVTRASFRLEDHKGVAFSLRASNGKPLPLFTLTPTRCNMLVLTRGGVVGKINLVEMNERCKRPIPTFVGTKSGDTVQCEFETSSDGVRFKSVKINDHLVFSSTDSREEMFGDKKDDCLLDSSYGLFSFRVEGKVHITDLVLA